MEESEIKLSLEKIMKEAGKLLLSFWRSGVGEIKKNCGYYTQADIESEEFLKKELYALKRADFCAEESGISGNEGNGFQWVIDPLDGTTNFAHHIPYFCISVALAENGIPVLGAIYNPLLDELFYAEKGKGAMLNGKKITVSDPKSFSDAIIAIGLSYKHIHRASIVHLAERVSREARTVRHFGAVALDLANVACGRIDGVAFSHLAWWDVAAGAILVAESGGKITEFDELPLTIGFKSCMAGGPLVYDNLKGLTKKSSDS